MSKTTVFRRVVNGLFDGKRMPNIFSTIKSKFNRDVRPAASSNGFVAVPSAVSDSARHEPQKTLGAGRVFRAVREMPTIDCVPRPCAEPKTATVARQYFRQPSVVKSGLFRTVDGRRMRNVFSTDENVASNSNPNRPAANSDSFVAGQCRPVTFETSGNVADFECPKPRGILGTGRIFRAVRGMPTINCVPKPGAELKTATVARQYFRQPSVVKSGLFRTVDGRRMRNVFSTDENVESNSNPNRPAANNVSVVAEHNLPALVATSGNALDLVQTEPQEKKKEDKSSKSWGQSALINRPPINTIAINGFGQFGSHLLRQIIKSEIVVAINDPFVNLESIANSLKNEWPFKKYYKEMLIEGDNLHIAGQKIRILQEQNVENINWRKLEAGYVIDSTGNCVNREMAMKHVSSGARKVILTSPCKDVPTFFRGIYGGYGYYHKNMSVVSVGSSLTNCFIPLIKFLEKHLKIDCCVMQSPCYTPGKSYTRVPINTGPINNISGTLKPSEEKPEVEYFELHLSLRSKEGVDIIKELILQYSFEKSELIICLQALDESDILHLTQHISPSIVDMDKVSVDDDNRLVIGIWHNHMTSLAARVLELKRRMELIDYCT